MDETTNPDTISEASQPVRTERSFLHYSRGNELKDAIHTMWADNNASGIPSAEIERRIRIIMENFDLTISEWHHWARHLSRWER